MSTCAKLASRKGSRDGFAKKFRCSYPQYSYNGSAAIASTAPAVQAIEAFYCIFVCTYYVCAVLHRVKAFVVEARSVLLVWCGVAWRGVAWCDVLFMRSFVFVVARARARARARFLFLFIFVVLYFIVLFCIDCECCRCSMQNTMNT